MYGAKPVISSAARILSLLVLVAATAWAAPQQQQQATVEVREITQTASFDCTAAAPYGSHVTLTPSADVTIGKVMATEGAWVERGEVLLMISDPHTRNAYRNATSALRQERQRLEAAREQYRPYLETAAGRVRSARDRVAAGEKALVRARTAVTVYDAMPSSGAPLSSADGQVRVAGAHDAPPRVVVRHQADPHAVSTASASLTAARNELAAAERGQADAKLHVRKALAPLEQRRDQAYAAFRKAQQARKEDQVKATMSGTLTAIAKPGQAVAKGQPMAEVVQLDKVVCVAVGPKDALQPVAVNQRVVLSVNGSALPAVITDKKEAGGQTKMTIRFDNREHAVKPGDHGKVTARTAHAAAVPCVPVRAVRGGRVTVLRGGEWRDVLVETGISDGHWIAIRRGLEPGEKIALRD